MNDRLLKESDVLKAIDRRIEELSADPEFMRKHGHIDVAGVKKHILDIPSADRPQWIPCSERLPQLGQKVLASTKKTVFTQVFKGYYSEPNKWAWERNSVKTIEAWMPLPTEYKGAEDDR